MSFGDQLPKLKLGRLSRRELGDYGLERLKKRYYIPDIDDLISDLMYLVDSGLFHNFFEVYSNWKEPVYPLSEVALNIAAENSLLVIAKEYLDHSPIGFRSDLINYYKFYYFYPVLEWVYSMHLGRDLEPQDIQRLFCSSLGERIIFYLEDFDIIEKNHKPLLDFFKKLKELKWENKDTKKIYKELLKIVSLLSFEKNRTENASFDFKIYDVILFLAGCSAVKNDRNKIRVDDVLTAQEHFIR